LSRHPNALLVTGTDTGAGKTVVTSALVAYWHKYYGLDSLGLMKPIQSGEGDRELYQSLFDLPQTSEELTPLYFQAPLAPPIAAAQEGKSVGLERPWKQFQALTKTRDWVLVEALGGLGSPITEETIVADLAWDWRIPTILVVPVKLGAIGQAVANVALARQSKVHLKGIVLNCPQHYSAEEIEAFAPARMIASLTQTPVLGCMPYLPDTSNLKQLAKAASNLNLERFMPLKAEKMKAVLSEGI
jgi:dethiobiotin synthetase